MVISSVNAANTVLSNGFQVLKPSVDKKAEPKAVQPAFVQNSGDALKSYFLGSQSVNFGFQCSTGKFITKKMADVPCCCCGGKMMLNQDLGKVAGSFAGKKGNQLADKIERDKSYFRSNQGAIAGMIAAEAKNTGLDAQGAVAAIRSDFKGKLQDYCQGVLSKTSEIANAELGEKNPVSSLIEKEQEKVADGRIDRVSFTEKLVKMHDAGTIGEESYDKIINSVMELPQNEEMVRKHFNKISGQSNQGIFHELLKESTQTIEHVHPHSMGGPNNTDNYLAECGECNHPRGNMSYSAWLKIHPEYPVNAQKHIEWFQQKIVDGKIDNRYDDYGTKIKATLSKESNGRMELRVLDKEKIAELRDKSKKGEKVSVSEEVSPKKPEEDKKKAA